eukprot:m.191191 g.191191  ORF g.191191 m.191191 type:complete len:939 (+) comp18245_c0_seq1:119-2935(+)
MMFVVACLLSLLCGALPCQAAAAAATHASTGLTLRVYNNTALADDPMSASVVSEPSLSLDASRPWSAYVSGTITFPAPGVYKFDCSFVQTTMAFVWVDGHTVCQDGNVYDNPAGSTDNPLPINRTLTLPFRAHVYNDIVGNASCTGSAAGCFNDTGHQCGFTGKGSAAGNDWALAATTCNQAGFAMAGAQNSKGEEIWCGRGVPQCPKVADALCHEAMCPGNVSEPCGGSWILQVLSVACNARPKVGNVTISMSVTDIGTNTRAAVEYATDLPSPEVQRDSLQRSLTRGWGTWNHNSMLDIVKLPEGAGVTPMLCCKSTGKCISTAGADGHKQKSSWPEVRVGLHAYDRSYAQFFMGPFDGVNANVSVELSASGPDLADLQLLVTPVECNNVLVQRTVTSNSTTTTAATADCSDYEVVVSARHFWLRAGTVGSSATPSASLVFDSWGFAPLRVFGLTSNVGSVITGSASLTLPLLHGAVGLSTLPGDTVAKARTALDTRRTAEEASMVKQFGSQAETAVAVKAAVMWTLVYSPMEWALCPVSRAWSFTHTSNTDFSYAIFDWDNLFASLMAGIGNKTIAYSNLFQVIKSKTAAGFVPNFAGGGSKSQDRTEPPVGSKVVLELYKKYKDAWVVELLFDDLLDWSNWFLSNRVLQPAGLIALGSWNMQRVYTGQGDPGNVMQDARFESGLDNSPQYDGNFFDDKTTHLMQLYDVGMSSMFVQEAYALSELATAIGRPEAAMLRARGDTMANKIQKELWDSQGGIYTNKFPNGTFYRRIAPTSFYALQTNAVSDSQAAAMMSGWLMNNTRFCISPTGDMAGNSDTCYWGLPSINAADPAFPPLGYWRGYVWGPMAQLTHWSLQNYDHVPEVRAARKAMCSQMEQLMLSQWRAWGHICENYNPHKTADTSHGDCSGTKFYHWGALTGLISLVENGHWLSAGL